MCVAFGDAAVFADHVFAVLFGQLEGRRKRASRIGRVFAHAVHAIENALYQARNNFRMIAIEIVAHSPNVGNQMIGRSGRDNQARALQPLLVRDIINIR